MDFLIGAIAGGLVVAALALMHAWGSRMALTDQAVEIKRLRQSLAAFDHDGDGKPGGSRPKH